MRALVPALIVTTVAAAFASGTAAPRSIRLDVIVTDSHGRTVENLGAADFELREDGAPHGVDEVRFVRTTAVAEERTIQIDSDASERSEAASARGRIVGIFLDEYHVDRDRTERVRTAVATFVDQFLSPHDLVVVMRPLDSVFTIRVTRDRARIHQAIDRFEGRQGDYTARNGYERNYMAGTAARIEQLRAQVAMSALNALATHLGSLNGDVRKTLVVVSEGLPSVDRRRGLETLPTLDTVMRSANRFNVSIYPVDPREPGAAPTPSEPDALGSLAASTDGRSIVHVSDLGAAMEPIAADAGAYYVLRYTVALTDDGRFHDVQVRVKKPGVIVRARKGYWAPTPDETLRAAVLQPRPPVPVEPPRHISPFIRAWFGASRGADGKTRVTFVWEPAPPIPGVKRPTPAHVVLKALAADDTPLFEGQVTPTGPLRPDTDAAGARAVFDVPPGLLRLRMAIEDQAEQAIDSDVRDITVRDLSAPVVLGTPEIFRGRTARDFRALASGNGAAPVASREFSRAEHVVIRVPAYAPAGAPLTVAAQLMNRKGQPIRDLAVTPAATPSASVDVDLPLAGYAVGEYRVEIAATTPTAQAKDALDFRITN